MSDKKIVACIYLMNGKAIKGFDDHQTVAEDAVELAVRYSNLGADELLIFDLSNTDEEHEAALGIIKEIGRHIDIPMIGAGNIKRTEDVKKLIYAGCQKAAMNMAKQANIDLIEEVSKRFGKDKIAVCADAEEQIIDHFDLLDQYCCGAILLNSAPCKGYKSLSVIPVLNDPTIEKIPNILQNSGIAGISGDVINFNVEQIMQIKRMCADQGIEMNTYECTCQWSDFKLNTDGHITVVVQDYKTAQVLMVAYMDEEAYQKTVETGRMTYYSRSRNELWVKGETSGHFQYVKELTADCDMDTILAKVSQVGPACHTGSTSCFFNEILKKEYSNQNPLKVFEDVYAVIADRKINPKEGSYTNYLFDKGVDKILKKIGEEATEIVIAAKNPDKEEIKYEISDFLYHAMVLMVENGITWQDITRELANR